MSSSDSQVFFSFSSPPLSFLPSTFFTTLLPFVLNMLLPLILLSLLFLPSIPTPAVFRPFLTYEDVLPEIVKAEGNKPKQGMPMWKLVAFLMVGVGQVGAWFSVGVGELMEGGGGSLGGVEAWVLAFVWTTTTLLHPLLLPSPIPTYPTFLFHLTQLLSSSQQLLSALYLFLASSALSPPSPSSLIPTLLNFASALVVLAIQLSLPIAVLPEAYHQGQPVGVGGRNPEEECSLWSWATFGFMDPLLKVGWVKTLDEEDVWKLSAVQGSGVARRMFQEEQGGNGVFRKVLKFAARELTGDFICSVSAIFLAYASPFFMKQVLDAIDHPSPEAKAKAYIYALGAMGASLVRALLIGWGRRFGTSGELRTRAMLMSAIYAKALVRKDFSGVVSSKAPKKKDRNGKKIVETKTDGKPQATGADIGKIVSMMSNDSTRVANRITNASDIYGPPIEIVIASVFLYQLLGLSAFAGSVALILIWPVNSKLRKRAVALNKAAVESRDKRMSVMNEIILSIKLIKFLGWEPRWTEKAKKARNKEMKWIIRMRGNTMLSGLVWGLSPITVMLISFLFFVTLGKGQLTVSIAFTSLSLYSMLAGPLSAIPAQMTVYATQKLAIERLDLYFAEPEVPDFVSSLRKKSSPLAEAETRLGIEKGTFRWNVVEKDVKTRDDTIFELGELSIIFPEGEMTVVSGPVGSGKSALLLALLGETECISGKVFLPKSGNVVDGFTLNVAYCAQNSFLQQRSIKDNITFGSPWDEERYEHVIHACALAHDLEVLEDGDLTEIGVKGVVLSGGQKARVALARAMYSRAKTLLLDDPLAAVDVTTARHLFEHCLTGPLIKGRTVVLVSHHVELLLPAAHTFVRMLDGRLDVHGTVEELRAQGVLPTLLASDTRESAPEDEIPTEDAKTEGVEASDGKLVIPERKKPRKLYKKEERNTGNVSSRIYKLYIEVSGYGIWAIVIALLVLAQGNSVLSRFWMKVWGEAYKEEALTLVQQGPVYFEIQLPSAFDRPLFYLGIYGGLSILTVLIQVIQLAVSYVAAYRAAIALHDRLLLRVVKAPPRWFDTTPAGRILNRFSADLGALDGSLSTALRTALGWAAGGISAVFVVCTVEPWFIIPAIVLSFIYFRLSSTFARTSRDLRRMLATARSPLFSSFGEVLDGITTVRAFSSEVDFLSAFDENVDKLLSKMYYNWTTNRWMLLRFDALGACATFISMALAIYWSVSAGSSAMAILATQSFVQALYWICRNLNQLELAFNAVERIDEYLYLDQEPPYVIESNRPPAFWPSSTSGQPIISVRDLEMKYAPDLPSVLHGVSFDIKAGEKIGLIGRTASGKSTLALALLRFTDPSSGSIFIDGIDITKIGVQDLRTSLTFIPQDATLFSGTLRENLDPFGLSSDEDLLDILRRVHLVTERSSQTAPPSRAPSFLGLPDLIDSGDASAIPSPEPSIYRSTIVAEEKKVVITLDSAVSSGGLNFSSGQRQLIAMGRSLLRGNNIVIMDEATASVDMETDDLIQKTIREELKDVTVLTIAHRLSSVIDYDRLLVLEQGRIAEFDTPSALLANPDGIFTKMVVKSGKYEELKKAAENRFGTT
ncbi:hypothetical protein BDY24DRAFT_117838 [Mrakia frigida]|uniref:uncharacterized protein n=1 Tax=Mrakia frigida TaxID=29902 RepID=UPI003FCC2134